MNVSKRGQYTPADRRHSCIIQIVQWERWQVYMNTVNQVLLICSVWLVSYMVLLIRDGTEGAIGMGQNNSSAAQKLLGR